MPILQRVVDILGAADLTKDIGQAVDNLINAKDAADVGAAAGELAASLATGVAVHGLIRPAFQGLRLGLALSGQIWKWEALTKAAGIAGGVSSGLVINWLRDLELGSRFYDWIHADPLTNDRWNQARTPTPHDPLAIDLDGDGIETVGIPATGSPVLFDHDADGVRTGTGWLRPDDAWLVLDRNGNGIIDSGRELFGVDTLITVTESDHRGTLQTVTRNATSGFEALRTLDVGNGTAGSAGHRDNVFNASDAAFTQVRVWRDLNGDGVSQAGELQTLAQAGIASVSLNATPTTINLGNGNTVTGTAVVTRTNGTTTLAEMVSVQASNLDLTNNPFYREFTDTIPLTDAARALPEMGGSGVLRDLREAMSLGTPQANSLVSGVQGFAAAGTRTEQWQRMDALLEAWASTSAKYQPMTAMKYLTETTVREDATTITKRYVGNGVDHALYPDKFVVMSFDSNDYLMWATDPVGGAYQTLNAAGMEVLRRIGVLEAFNGAPFVDFTMTQTKSTGGGGLGGSGGGGGGGAFDPTADKYFGRATLRADQVASVNQAYDALTDSVYAALALQTRLRPYLDAIELVFDGEGVRFDTTALNERITSQYASQPQKGLEDLAELLRFAAPTLAAVGYDGVLTLRDWVEALPAYSPLWAALANVGVRYGDALSASERGEVLLGGAGNNPINGLGGDDVVDGGAGDDQIDGGEGDDFIWGRQGADRLYGGSGADTLDGGAGNDTLVGGVGNNTYLFGRGDGQDYLQGYERYTGDGSATKLNTLQFKTGVLPTDLVLRQVNDNWFGATAGLEVTIAGTTDKITISGFFAENNAASQYNPVQQFRFSDGTVWNMSAILANLFAGTADADTLVGTNGNDTINGAAGADNIAGGTGDDILNGGADNDILNGQAGNNTLDGGAGNDTLVGGVGNNTYLFGRGDGQDYLQGYERYTGDGSATKLNTLQFKTGVLPTDLVLRQVNDNWFGATAGLEVSISGTTDKITISGFFAENNAASQYNPVQQFRFSDGTVWNMSAILANLFAGTADADTLVGTNGNDTINGAAGADNIAGGTGNDTLNGGAGNDTLYGENGNDTLDGGAGNDTLVGGLGNNTYLFGKGDGHDLVRAIDDATVGKLNTLQFKTGVVASEVVLRQAYDNDMGGNVALEVSITGTTDKITLNGVFNNDDPTNSYNSLQQIRFADGTTWNWAAIQSKLFAGTTAANTLTGTIGADVISGQAGADVLYGRDGNDNLNGGAGNDTLYGENGNDRLDGGTGNDTLVGGVGNNTYLFGRGDGQDYLQGYDRYTGDSSTTKLNTLQFKTGVLPTDLVLRQVNDNWFGATAGLEVSIAGTTDKITVSGFFFENNQLNQYNPIQQFRFSNGTVWNMSAILSNLFAGTAGADTLVGTNGNDTINGAAGADNIAGGTGDDILNGGADNDSLNGQAGNDTLDGGTGNDTLVGGVGNNTYLFGRGDGQDYLQGYDRYTGDSSTTKLNTLQFKTGMLPTDLVLRQVNDNWFGATAGLEVSISGTTDKITISGFFAENNAASQYNPVQQFRFSNGTVWNTSAIVAKLFAGTAGADTLVGTNGNDTVNGAAGADNIAGGTGNDILNGGADNDSLNGQAGNDRLDGGTGNDTLVGGVGNNTYLFGRGEGQDYLQGYDRYTGDGSTTKLNMLQFKTGVLPTDLVLRRVNDNWFGATAGLEVSIAGTTDKITISGFSVTGDAARQYNPVQQFRFSNGTIWNLAGIESRLSGATATITAQTEQSAQRLVEAMAVFDPDAAIESFLPYRHHGNGRFSDYAVSAV